MRIYFSASISGGRKYLDIYKKIVAYLKEQGHQVLTEHIVIDNIFDFENQLSPQAIFERDIQWLNECDRVVAEVSNPSLGVGYEICYALEHRVPTLCLYQPGIFVSRMIIGNTSPYLTLYEYRNEPLLFQQLDEFLGRANLKAASD
ncbi:MAG: nucleoside 2-deoxyribosyltransferase [candidate division KSB1 bacterium]|nr:nucleoside 2-deoxyribosyltransferase [candidate division KSB1 bacterium]MDZ7334828.1 nucleoside 2-deoxyribosyltransferase [candidate division KSB1 bacterium]MDZ7356542.1 nucleoside 2-deoxyribosyltransferase [candidate division KSB1 bacterium]MDZ7376457.1 nucleoside 2-deoxyribosyltransferase [candidate division KSB1 bacterium]MDZ7400443.1 nucleoside 2-deoxyribosyltransferase [candidate division KSB1 bacterium]